MEKHYELSSSNKYGQESCTLTSSIKRGRLAIFMVCIMAAQILSDISLEISTSNYLANLIVAGICSLSILSCFFVIGKKTDLFIGNATIANTLFVCSFLTLLFQRAMLLNLFGLPANKSIVITTIVICLLFRLAFWIYLVIQSTSKYHSTAGFGILTVAISFLGLLTFCQNESVHIDLVRTVFGDLFYIISLFNYSIPIEISHFYLIGDSVLWMLPFITLFWYQYLTPKK